MSGLSDDSGRGLSVPALVATALLAHDLPDSSISERRRAASYVEESVAAMPDVTRAGVRLASIVVYAGLSVMARTPFRRAPLSRQSALAGRLGAVSLPVLGEFVRLTRGLGLVGIYEERTRAGALGADTGRTS